MRRAGAEIDGDGGMTWLLVAVGGALGSVARYGFAMAVARLTGPGFPYGTIIINIAGSLLIGWFSALTGPMGRLPAPDAARVFVMAGICGGFTTFSAFSLQTMELLRAGEGLLAFANVAVSVICCLGATALGFRLAGP